MAGKSPFDKLIGTVLGNYRLECVIEEHKWGPIFLASGITGKSYVVRFLGTPSPDKQHVYGEPLQQEASQVSVLHHPHILPLLDYNSYDGVPYFIYPYAHSTTLRALLKPDAQLDTHAVARYLDEIADALEYAHARGVLHRNLSTDCIYIFNNQLFVAEFSLIRMYELSKPAVVKGKSGSTSTTYDGSSESSSPEQLLGKPIDASADIYALGTVLYHLLTGHAPFTGKSDPEIARQHLYAKVPPISTWRSGLPVDIDHIITKAMEKDPAQRFARPSALVEMYYQIVGLKEVPLSARRGIGSISGSIRKPRGTSGSIADRRKSTSGSISGIRKPQQDQVSRRHLFTWLGVGVASTIAVAVAGIFVAEHIVAGTATKPPVLIGEKVLAHSANVPINSAIEFPYFEHQRIGLLIHLPNDHFVAFDATCTHAGCSVHYNQQDHLLICPCHNSTFDPAMHAEVKQGPAQTPLEEIKIVLYADGTITTDRKK